MYRQPDKETSGYNPNEEHAFLDGKVLSVLRSDLNLPNETSKPWVLIRYEHPKTGVSRLKAFHVLPETTTQPFRYRATAGTRILPPQPLQRVINAEVNLSGPKFIDRNSEIWAKAAGDNGGAATMVNQYYYASRPNYDFPASLFETRPANGELIPWLSRWADQKRTRRGESPSGKPLDITYEVVWSRDVPLMKQGQTLTVPKDKLPDIIDQKSAQIVYDQSLALGNAKSAALIDATRVRRFPDSSDEGAVARDTLHTELTQAVLFPPLVENIAGNYYFPTLSLIHI